MASHEMVPNSVPAAAFAWRSRLCSCRHRTPPAPAFTSREIRRSSPTSRRSRGPPRREAPTITPFRQCCRSVTRTACSTRWRTPSHAAEPTTAATTATGAHRRLRPTRTIRTSTIPRADWANCFFDSKNVLSAYAVYEIPFGHGKRWGSGSNAVVNAVAGGWSVNPIVSVHSGFPVALYDFNFATATPLAQEVAACARIAALVQAEPSEGKSTLIRAAAHSPDIDGSTQPHIPILLTYSELVRRRDRWSGLAMRTWI